GRRAGLRPAARGRDERQTQPLGKNPEVSPRGSRALRGGRRIDAHAENPPPRGGGKIPQGHRGFLFRPEPRVKGIRTAAVVGSGTMGAQIAAHLASGGIPVLLLDVPAEGGSRNALAEKGKQGLRKLQPSPFYSARALDLISTGNISDDLDKAGKTD